MINTNLLDECPSRRISQSKGNFKVIEYIKDMSVTAANAQTEYYASRMNVRKRQVVAELSGGGVVVQAGAMQLMVGDVSMTSDVKGAGDLIGKMFSSKVTGETAIKPRYTGTGTLVLEPTYKHIIIEDLNDWGGSIVLDDGLFLACSDTVKMSVAARNNLSSAIAGGEGLFNTMLSGKGMVVLESPVPEEELFVFELENDTLKIDGNMAIAWSNSLQFTVERSSRSLIGSAASGEGLVNVYRGTGRVAVAPVTL